MILLFTALAGGFGGAARFIVDTLVNRRNRLSTPMGTQVINITACLGLGLLAGYVGSHGGALYAVAGTGFMGGYSTFSTASVEAARLMIGGRITSAAMHAVSMILLSYAAAILGIALGGAL
ncbi:MAG: fluoride efflux transporter FluC [Ancrocorticia sp.]|uniref:fluoride efflux transporter FluC n=1 Tax=Ancrocorticia sp. TaxID=2593684 RepID=UPI003F8DFD8E